VSKGDYEFIWPRNFARKNRSEVEAHGTTQRENEECEGEVKGQGLQGPRRGEKTADVIRGTVGNEKDEKSGKDKKAGYHDFDWRYWGYQVLSQQ